MNNITITASGRRQGESLNDESDLVNTLMPRWIVKLETVSESFGIDLSLAESAMCMV